MPSSTKHTARHTSRLPEKTVLELRAQAKSLGLTKYTKLTKAQLVRRIATATRTASTKTTHKISKKQKKPSQQQKATRRPTATKTTAPRARQPSRSARRQAAQHIISSVGLDNAATATPSGNQDRTPVHPETFLPPPHDAPMLTVRGQKPGVLHAAWNIDPMRSMPLPYLRLRILKANAEDLHVIDEVTLSHLRGSRYFHLAAEFHDTALRAEVGYHSSDGRFIVMRRHADVRLPSQLAAGRGDPQWWISETDFRELYLRSGGAAENQTLVWRSSFSSR